MKLLAGLLAGSLVVSLAFAQQPAVSSSVNDSHTKSTTNWHARQSLYYKRNWGVDIIGVKPVTSGYMLAFRYRIVDPVKAKILNDRQTKAYLRDETTGNVLAVPAMENVGELRSGTSPEVGRIYFMIFGNPGKLVKSGSRVSVVAGNFSVEGLLVD